MTRKIWVDTDVALGAPRGDVDDGFALAAVALADREGAAVLEGVSVVSGNTQGTTAFQAARALLEVLGVSCPLVPRPTPRERSPRWNRGRPSSPSAPSRTCSGRRP